MKKYLMMLLAAALIASAPIYYAMTAQAEEKAGEKSTETVEITIDCTKATLDGEEVPEECKVIDDATEEVTTPAAE